MRKEDQFKGTNKERLIWDQFFELLKQHIIIKKSDGKRSVSFTPDENAVERILLDHPDCLPLLFLNYDMYDYDSWRINEANILHQAIGVAFAGDRTRRAMIIQTGEYVTKTSLDDKDEPKNGGKDKPKKSVIIELHDLISRNIHGGKDDLMESVYGVMNRNISGKSRGKNKPKKSDIVESVYDFMNRFGSYELLKDFEAHGFNFMPYLMDFFIKREGSIVDTLTVEHEISSSITLPPFITSRLHNIYAVLRHAFKLVPQQVAPVLPDLTDLLEHEIHQVRIFALKAYNLVIKYARPMASLAIIEKVGRLCVNDDPEMFKNGTHRPTKVREWALQTLTSAIKYTPALVSQDALRGIIDLLSSENNKVQYWAKYALNEAYDLMARDFPTLLPLLEKAGFQKDPDITVKYTNPQFRAIMEQNFGDFEATLGSISTTVVALGSEHRDTPLEALISFFSIHKFEREVLVTIHNLETTEVMRVGAAFGGTTLTISSLIIPESQISSWLKYLKNNGNVK